MNQIKVVTSGERNIQYEQILGFFSYTMSPASEIPVLIEEDAVVIDIRNKKEIIEVANTYRRLEKSLPLLILTDPNINFTPQEIVNIKGSGQVRLFSYTGDSGEKIVELINSIITPEFASEIFRISIVVPIYNEEERFRHVLKFAKKLNKFLEENYRSSKIYFINDGSIDNTEAMASKLIEYIGKNSSYVSDFGFLQLRNLEENTRKAGTYIEGLKNVPGNIIILVDGDDSFLVEDIGKMINILRDGYYDMVAATKDLLAENRPPIRRMLSFCKRIITKPLLPKGVYDSQTGLKGMTGEAAKYLLPHLNVERELAIDLEMLYLCKRMNFRVYQFPVKTIDRDGSHVDIVGDSLKYLKSIYSIVTTRREV